MGLGQGTPGPGRSLGSKPDVGVLRPLRRRTRGDPPWDGRKPGEWRRCGGPGHLECGLYVKSNI